MVTPDMAKLWLKNNEGNRNLSDSAVERYVSDMKRGTWKPNTDSIGITKSGQLIQGQHRLTAVVESECTVLMLVTYGYGDDVFSVLDRGRGRSFADQLRSAGEVNVSVLGAVLTCGASFQQGVGVRGNWTLNNPRITDTDRSAYLAQNPSIRNSVSYYGNTKYVRSTGLTKTVLAFSHHLILREAGAEAAAMFMHQLVTQDRESISGTIRSVLRYIQNTPGAGSGELSLTAVIWAWNHWSAGREVSAVRINKDEIRKAMPKISKTLSR